MEDRQFDLCMERILQGDKDALQEIYQAYLGYIFYLILGIVGNREDAEDITSEFFVKLWNVAEKYQPGSGHKTWMSMIARNMALDFLRSHKKAIAIDLTEEQSENALEQEKAGTEAYDSTVETEVLSDMRVAQILGLLKPAEREIVHMKILGEFTFREISKMTKLPMGTVTWRYREAIKKLRRFGYESGF